MNEKEFKYKNIPGIILEYNSVLKVYKVFWNSSIKIFCIYSDKWNMIERSYVIKNPPRYYVNLSTEQERMNIPFVNKTLWNWMKENGC